MVKTPRMLDELATDRRLESEWIGAAADKAKWSLGLSSMRSNDGSVHDLMRATFEGLNRVGDK